MSTTWTSPGANFYIENAGNLRWQIYTQNSDDTSNRVPAKQWSHVAWCESSGTGYLFLNGVLIESKSSITNAIGYSNYFYTGSRGGTNPFTGYMSNVKTHRVALYTSAFTPPTSPLTATSDTTLLTHQTYHPSDSTAIGDKSGGEMPLTIAGDINTSSFSPYSPFGYSAYFDGSGDYLTYPNSSSFLVGSGDFTLECWVNPEAAPGGGVNNDYTIFGSFSFSPAFYFALDNTTLKPKLWNGTTTEVVNISPTANQWSHIVFCREGNTLRGYVNGVLGLENTSYTTNWTGSNVPYTGRSNVDTTRNFRGYISNLKFVKGTALYTSAFTPPTTSLIPTTGTSLLALQSPSLVDNGPHRHTITRYGDARVTPYAPFKGHTVAPDSHSNYFDGTGDYLASNTAISLGTGDFTIECWFYAERTQTYQGLFETRPDSTDGAYPLVMLNHSNVVLYVSAGVRLSAAFQTYTWHHVAVCRESGTSTIYLDGVATGSTYTDSNNYSSRTDPYIGALYGGGNTLKGYISNLRVVAGTALYTSNFTPSTSPLTTTSQSATASEVSLLTCQSSTLVDNSLNAHTITSYGNTQPVEFNPFGFTTTSNVGYNPVTHAGSMYGDGTTDYVDVPANAWNSVGTGDFCIQFWTYSKEVDANKGQIAIGGNKISIRFDSSNRMTFWVAGNGGPTSTPNNTVYPFNWYHVCLERSGSTNTLYINGVAKATNTTTPSNDASPIIRIGGQYADNTGYTFTGWISDVSIRSKAVYKGNFVPPKQVTYGDQTKLQVPFNDAAIYDAKGQLTYDIGALRTSSAVTKFNNTSLDFSPNDYLNSEERHGTTKVYGKQLNLGTKDFTIEFWVNFNSLSGRQDIIWIGTTTRLGITYNLNAGELTYYAINESAITANPSFSTGTWYHVALSRYNGSTKLFVNGTQLGSTYTDSKNYSETILYIGRDSGAASSWFNGYLDNIRITKAGRYTSNFTAPTQNFSKN